MRQARVDDHLHARRVAVGLVVPGLVLVLAGRPDLIIYAVFGSFTGMYGRTESPGVRLGHQAQGGSVLLAGVATGVLLSALHAPPWVLVVTAVLFAMTGSLVADHLALRPEGPFFGIFALGATATVPAERVVPWAAVSICVATVLFCLAVSYTSATLHPSRRRLPSAPSPQPPDPLLQAVRYALAIAVAGSCGVALGIDHANWAMAAAAVPLATADARTRTDRTINDVARRGTHRVVGTMAGLAVTALLLLPHPSPTVLAIMVMALLFPTELFMSRHYGLALGFFTPLIMLMTELAEPAEPWSLLRDRAVDTVIGVAVGITVAVIIRGRVGADIQPVRNRPRIQRCCDNRERTQRSVGHGRPDQ